MNLREINKLQNNLFDELMPIYNDRGFEADRKRWLFKNSEVSFQLHVDTKVGDFYTLRPGIEINKIEIVKEINRIIKISGQSISFCSHFFLSHKLAEVYGITKYSECEENDFGRNQVYFRHKIVNENDIPNVTARHKEILLDFGWNTYQLTKELNTFQQLLLNNFTRFYESFKTHPNKNVTERPLRLTFESYLTMTLLLCRNSIQNALELVDNATELFGVESKLIKNMNLIIKEYR